MRSLGVFLWYFVFGLLPLWAWIAYGIAKDFPSEEAVLGGVAIMVTPVTLLLAWIAHMFVAWIARRVSQRYDARRASRRYEG